MQRVCWLVMVLMLPAISYGQDMKPDDMRKQLNSTLTELKAAQDRKAELAADNALLAARVADLEKQLATKNQQVADLNESAAEMADRTVLLRSHYAAWQEFMSANPSVARRWNYFLEAAAMSEGSLGLMQSNWPLHSELMPPPAGPRPVEMKPVVGTKPSATTMPSGAATHALAPTTLPAAVKTILPKAIQLSNSTRTSSTTQPSTASKP